MEGVGGIEDEAVWEIPPGTEKETTNVHATESAPIGSSRFRVPQHTRMDWNVLPGLRAGWVCKNFVRSHCYIYRHGSLTHAG